jgi:hypothetical protein
LDYGSALYRDLPADDMDMTIHGIGALLALDCPQI